MAEWVIVQVGTRQPMLWGLPRGTTLLVATAVPHVPHMAALYGAAPVPRPPLPAPEARDRVHAFLRSQGVTALTGVHLVRLLQALPDYPHGPRALSFAADQEVWGNVLAAWLARLPPQCRWMTTSPCRHGTNTTASPPSPPPLTPAQHYTALPTAHH